MSMPKISYPLITLTLPSTKKSETFRWMLRKEEKILLIAKETDGDADKKTAIRQVVNNCAVSPTFKIERLTTFDIEYCFLKIRAASVSNIVEVSFRDGDDHETYDFQIDLNKVEVKFPDDISDVIKINDQYSIKLKYPTADLYDDAAYYESKDITDIATKCLDKIFDGDSILDPTDSTEEEIREFYESLDQNTFAKIRLFFYTLPILFWEDKYTNKNGAEKRVALAGLPDFFRY
ncbi:MAG: hypothetical protein P4L79_09870 [Legionella sp.]|uniref:T4 family baseplate hub assembly chaperone n=1 Tax=Legionella sp. TaxID=459 RepID=UPI002842E377|nr:hypothetical protein [Legionella sp.]